MGKLVKHKVKEVRTIPRRRRASDFRESMAISLEPLMRIYKKKSYGTCNITLEVNEIILKGTLPNGEELELSMDIKQFNDWIKTKKGRL